MHSIYLAGRYSRRFAFRKWAQKLSAIGSTVTSRWIDTDDSADDPRASARDIADIDACDTLILQGEVPRTPTRGGRFFEFGYAYARGKQCLLIALQPENVFCTLDDVQSFDDFESCLSYLSAPHMFASCGRSLRDVWAQ